MHIPAHPSISQRLLEGWLQNSYIHTDSCTYMHIHAHTCRYLPPKKYLPPPKNTCIIHAHTCKTCTYLHVKIPTDSRLTLMLFAIMLHVCCHVVVCFLQLCCTMYLSEGIAIICHYQCEKQFCSFEIHAHTCNSDIILTRYMQKIVTRYMHIKQYLYCMSVHVCACMC